MNPNTPPHRPAAASGALAAAICMAISQLVFLTLFGSPAEALAMGASLSCIAFGLTYAGVFFVSAARRSKAPEQVPAKA